MIILKFFAFSIFGASATWEVTRQNKEIARKIIRSLEDRRLLFGPEDNIQTTQSIASNQLGRYGAIWVNSSRMVSQAKRLREPSKKC